MVKRFMLVIIIFMVAILVIPAILVTGFSTATSDSELNITIHEEEELVDGADIGSPVPEETEIEETEPSSMIETVSVFRSSNETIEEVSLEDYIIGVVASEMPASYEKEALKAQALTARTYLIRLLLDGDGLNLPEGSDVTDTVMHQVYKNDEELQELWGNDYEWQITRIRQAVLETEGQVITYDREPITATFFSTSNGYTENSEEYWENEIPYLRSVESPWDTESPRYMGEKSMTVEEFQGALDIQLDEGEVGEIISRTTGGRVATVKIGEESFTGREVRDALELDSSDFSWTRSGENIVIETRGWGHGVGMSQFGADSMAKAGNTYRDIIEHYYHNVDIEEATTVIVNNSSQSEEDVSNKLSYSE
ncbi:stage II sporulation protein D [Salipaludibacillus sp. HK11]|uniref:stage II sporulation protein D n=1 Tax=Salipaludibacillus sp. HK11 TaxID=3394320 RepID=UPI0039FBB742